MVRIESFDGLRISAFVFRPDPTKFPGPRPVLINIHGGPESQSRPVFQARNNYYLNELGVAVVHPNVRGSAGYGKTFLTLDNGFKREDSVRDIGAIIEWIRQDKRWDGERIAVMGGSYGGYMVLASMIHFGDMLRCGVDVVGISNFLTFLENTQDYRRDLRRVEYGDERDAKTAEFLGRISPTAQAAKIRKALLCAGPERSACACFGIRTDGEGHPRAWGPGLVSQGRGRRTRLPQEEECRLPVPGHGSLPR